MDQNEPNSREPNRPKKQSIDSLPQGWPPAEAQAASTELISLPADRGKQVPAAEPLILKGKVALSVGEPFAIPFESPAGGCTVRYSYEAVPESGHSVSFAICDASSAVAGEAIGAAVLHAASGEGCRGEGEASVADGGQMCLARWEPVREVLSLLSGLVRKSQPLVLAYEIRVLPSEHLALVARQRLVQLAQQKEDGVDDGGGGGGEHLRALRAALQELPVGAADDRGRTALHGAASAGNAEAIALLLRMKAPLEARSDQGRTPLLEACERCQLSAIAPLIAAGSQPHVVDACGCNALHLIAMSRIGEGEGEGGDAAAEAFRTLLAAGAKGARSPRSADLVRTLVRHKCGALFAEGDALLSEATPLVHAAAAGLTACCETLLEAGAQPDECCGRPLLAAARGGHTACVRKLLDAGAQPSLSSTPEGSVLHVAAGAGHADLVRMLCSVLARRAASQAATEAADATDVVSIGNGAGGAAAGGGAATNAAGAAGAATGGGGSPPILADLLRTNGAWRSPLLCAAAAGHGDCVEALVDAGSPLEQCDREGNSPLLSACCNGEPKAVAVLLAAGCQPRRRNGAGRDALLCAAAGGHVPVLPLLLPACADRLPEAMVTAAAAGQAKTAVALVELCPLPPPKTWRLKTAGGRGSGTPQEGRPEDAVHHAAGQLVRALWERVCEEHALLAPDLYSPPPPPHLPQPMAVPSPAVELEGAAARSVALSATVAAGAIIAEEVSGGPRDAAGGGMPSPPISRPAGVGVAGAGFPSRDSPRLASEEAGASAEEPVVLSPGAFSPLTPGGAEDDDGAAGLDLDDLTSIQDLIRMELEDDDDDGEDD